MASSDFKLLFLGTGTSTGVPMIGCDCPVCRSADPHNRRLRSSIYISAGDLRVLVDTSPDFREQALKHNIRKVDAVLITHAHVDHLFGLDDIRRLNTIQKADIPLYANSNGLNDIRRIFDYIFKPNVPGTYRPKLDLRSSDAPFTIHPLTSSPAPSCDTPSCGTAVADADACGGDGEGRAQSFASPAAFSVTPFPVVHGWTTTQGFRFDYDGASLAYMPDCNELPEGSRALIRGVDTLILDTLRYRPHPTHLSLEQSLAVIADIKPRRAWLTHICHDLDHEKLTAELIEMGFPNVRPAYDGLEIELGGTEKATHCPNVDSSVNIFQRRDAETERDAEKSALNLASAHLRDSALKTTPHH